MAYITSNAHVFVTTFEAAVPHDAACAHTVLFFFDYSRDGMIVPLFATAFTDMIVGLRLTLPEQRRGATCSRDVKIG